MLNTHSEMPYTHASRCLANPFQVGVRRWRKKLESVRQVCTQILAIAEDGTFNARNCRDKS
jgi:hypothetical protein